MDSTATAAMERIEAVPIKEKYCRDDIVALVATEGSHEKSPLPRLEKPADLGNPSPGLTFSW